MFSDADYDKLQQIMDESPEKREVISRLLTSHQMTVSTISHEIRNPLTLIYSTLQLMEKQYPIVHHIHYWKDIKHDVEYMKLLLEELSSYNNGNRLSFSHFDANTFFRTIALSFASSLVENKIQFISKIDSSLPLVWGDSVKLREALLNLLCNARDAITLNFSNCDTPAIHFSVTRQADILIITVKDNGCGMNTEQLSHIFEPFVTYKKGGTGLGLSLAQKVIKAHKGFISVTSVLHEYTTFTITLPIQ